MIFTVLGAVLGRKELRMRRSGIRVTATVSERVFKPGVSTPSGVVVGYTSRDGTTLEVALTIPPDLPSVQVGEPMEVVYNPENLREVRRAAELDSVKRPGVNGFLLLGGALLVGAVVAVAAGL
ncbi:DUF3592 domain-containing protein [Streptomyces brasiliscabiei]|uniref:DUF3592 domain-containing protein n=1 Tax=Streptomyces brasiliscabiei TaxID=2736302 RepID=A0ABU8GMQ2_9ACTN